MIIVPSPDHTAFSPDHDLPDAPHRLPTAPSDTAPDDSEAGALLTGFSHGKTAVTRQAVLAASPERKAAVRIKRILDHALVKDTVTALHQEHDAHRDKLAGYTGDALLGLLAEEEAFLKDQERRCLARFTGDRQRVLFAAMTAAYFAQAMDSARALRARLVLDYQRTVVGRQNGEFAERALAPDALFDDGLQSAYRDVILYNLDTLHADLPAVERQTLRDEACRDLYTRILEARLEADPSRLDSMLRSPAVGRVLGRQAVRAYRAKARAAIREETIMETTRQWVAEGLAPAEARHRIHALPEADRAEATRQYRAWRRRDGRQRFLSLVAELEAGWRAVAEGGYRTTAIPAAVRRSQPALAELFVQALEVRAQHGGQPPAPDYARLAALVLDHQPGLWAETLRDPDRACRFVRDLGGPESPAFQAALRFLIGKATEEDSRLFTDLGLARTVWTAAGCDGGDRDESAFLGDFVKARRIALDRARHGELTTPEARALAEACLPVRSDCTVGAADEKNRKKTPLAARSAPNDAVQ